MSFLKLLFLLPSILQVIRLVEELITDASQGSLKKEIAISFLEALVVMGTRFGFIKDIKWEEVKPIVSETIDLVVDILNRSGVFKH